MKKNVLYSGITNNYLLETIINLKDNYNWNPCFVYTSENFKKKLTKKFPNIKFSTAELIRILNFNYENFEYKKNFDPNVIKLIPYNGYNYLSWLEDTTGWNFSFSERKDYLFELLNYWNTVLVNVKPDIIFFNTWPHTADYPLYILAKYVFKIDCIFINPIPFFNKNLYTIGINVEDLSDTFKEDYLNGGHLKISKIINEYIKDLKYGNPSIPKHVSNYYKFLDNNYNSFFTISNFFKIFKQILSLNIFKTSSYFFKKNRINISNNKSRMTNLNYIFFKINLFYKNTKLKNYYLSLCKKVKFEENYIYFPAPYQPEVLSNLYAGHYEDILKVIDMINETMPKNWKIYFKEHNNTFKKFDKGALYRKNEFYNELNKYKNLKLVDFNLSTFDLIDNAKVTITIGGTAGWESVIRGIPSIVFGSLFYSNCNSIFSIKNIDDLNKSFNKIINGFKPDIEDIKIYAETIYRQTSEFLKVESWREDFNDDNIEIISKKSSEFIYNLYNKFYSK